MIVKAECPCCGQVNDNEIDSSVCDGIDTAVCGYCDCTYNFQWIERENRVIETVSLKEDIIRWNECLKNMDRYCK